MAAFVLLILALFSGAVSAQEICYTYSATYSAKTGTDTTPQGAAAALVAKLNTGGTGSCPPSQFINDVYSVKTATTSTLVLGHNRVNMNYEPTGNYIPGTSNPEYACRDRSAVQSDKTGMMGRVATQCAPPNVCDEFKGNATGMGPMDFSVGTSTASGMAARMGTTGYGCFGGCTVQGTVTGGGVFGGSGIVTLTGTSFTGGPACTEDAPGSGSDTVGSTTTTYAPPSPCSKGQCPGEVNGATVCVPCTSNSTVDTSVKQGTQTTGSGTATQTTTATSTQTTVTSCDVTTGLCTTSKTTAGTTDGNPTTSVEKSTATVADFCRDNPKHKSCSSTEEEKEGSFSGSCQTNFTCEGDAVTCATAAAVNTQLCNFSATFSVSAEVRSDYALIASGSKIPNPKDNPTTRNLGTFDQTNPFSNTCPVDVAFNVSGKSFVIPLAGMCDELQMLGNALVAFTLLAATLFVLKGAAT